MTSSLAASYPGLLAIPFGDTKKNGFIPVNWGMVEQIRAEADANETVNAALAVLTQTLFRGGFTFVFSRLSTETGIDPWFEENVLATEWMPQMEKLLRHFIYYGFAVVTYVTTPSGNVVPCVLDTSVYMLYYRVEPDGGRRYSICPTLPGYLQPPASTTDDGLLHNARLLVASEPDAYGVPMSRIRSVLPSLVIASELWRNLRHADRERTHPLFVYERPGGAAKSMIVPGNEETLDFSENDARVHDGTLLRRTLNEADRIDEKIAAYAARAQNTGSLIRDYDKTTGAIVTARAPMPWEKNKHVPAGVKLVAPPEPQLLPFFNETLGVINANIAQAVGVPIALLTNSGGARTTGVADATMGMLRSSVLSWQQTLSAHIATLYIDVFRDVHVEDFKTAMLSAQKHLGVVLDEEDLARMRMHFFVRVLFKNTPGLGFEDVKALREARYISHETAQKLALGVFNLPLDLAMTAAEDAAERRRDAESEAAAAKLLADATAQAKPAGGAPKPAASPSKTAAQPPAKRAKVDTK